MEREVQSGQLIAGKYRVEQVLGRGGMGVVMAALHEQLNQRVALKFLTDNAFQQPEAVTRFLREARAAVQIQSEHVARVMDVGTLDSGAPYMVMEYLRGRDLKEVSSRRGPLPITEAVDYLLQACDAVAEAHSLGIVHRDLKPSNLFLTERPDGSPLVKVLDFGISKALQSGERSQLQMTASAAIMGSPQYMSPEQIRSSKNVDARADVWALGTILHELLTGTPAYVADTVPGLLAMIVADAPPPLSASRPDAPSELEAAILRCLEKDRERRFASVAVLARSLERFASAETRPLVRRIARVLGDDAPPPTEVAPPATVGLTMNEPVLQVGQTNGTWARTGRQLRDGSARSPLYVRPDVQLGAGLGVLVLGGLIWFMMSGSGDSPEGDTYEPALAATPVVSAPPAVAAPPVPAPLPARIPVTPAPEVSIVAPETPRAQPAAAVPTRNSESKDSAARDSQPNSAERSASGAKATKKSSSAATRPPHTTAAAKPPARPRTSETAPPSGAASPPPTPKKADLGDLFNDTK
jgi:serine/threonine-protein kinase